MPAYTFRPAKRENTPLIIGIAGPTKSGKTYSAHRLAKGLAGGAPVAMINAEGARGHQYSDVFDYLTVDLTPPYRPEKYTDALQAALAMKPRPGAVIIDSCSHMHNGPGGVLDWHESELDRLAGKDADYKKRERYTWTAWIKPKAAEAKFVYAMLDADCPLILCFRAKEKLKIVKGKEPENLGWQPIAGEAVSFETIFTLVLPPHSAGVPDLSLSELRSPFDKMIPPGAQLNEGTGIALAQWSAGASDRDDADALTEEAQRLIARALELTPDEAKRQEREANIAKARQTYPAGRFLAWLGAQVERLEREAAAAEQEALDL